MLMVTDPSSTALPVDDACPEWCTYDHAADEWPDDQWHSSEPVEFTLTHPVHEADEVTGQQRVALGAAYLARDWGHAAPHVVFDLPRSVTRLDRLRLTVDEAHDLAALLHDLVERARLRGNPLS
jgi:hypothetical protein